MFFSERSEISLRKLKDDNYVYGGKLRKECVVSTPGWTTKWQYPDGGIKDTPYLWLDNLARKDAGTYWCIATKDGATKRFSFRIAFTNAQINSYSGLTSIFFQHLF